MLIEDWVKLSVASDEWIDDIVLEIPSNITQAELFIDELNVKLLDQYKLTLDVVYEDVRYPILVVNFHNNEPSIGFSLNHYSGRVLRICICHAFSALECVCGALDIDEVY